MCATVRTAAAAMRIVSRSGIPAYTKHERAMRRAYCRGRLHADHKESVMKVDATHPGTTAGDPGAKALAAATHERPVRAAAMAHMDLIAKFQAIDGCSKEQAEDEVKAFERAFRAL